MGVNGIENAQEVAVELQALPEFKVINISFQKTAENGEVETISNQYYVKETVNSEGKTEITFIKLNHRFESYENSNNSMKLKFANSKTHQNKADIIIWILLLPLPAWLKRTLLKIISFFSILKSFQRSGY